jgi:hypothetical protein
VHPSLLLSLVQNAVRPATKIFSLPFSLEDVMTENSIHQAVELAKVAVTGTNAPWINDPKKVADFIEVIAKKLQELRNERG